LNATFHADSSEGAVKRFLTAYLAESGNEPAHIALDNLVSELDIHSGTEVTKGRHP